MINRIENEEKQEIDMKSKFENGSLQLSNLESELKHYLVKRIGQKNAEILYTWRWIILSKVSFL